MRKIKRTSLSTVTPNCLNRFARAAVTVAVTAAVATAIGALGVAFVPRPALAQTQLLTNGGFEAGSFAGWRTFNQSDAGTTAGFFVDDNTNSPGYSPNDPSTGYPFFTPGSPVNDLPTAGARTGNFYAVTDGNGAASNALIQTFTVPVNATQVTLSFALFVNARDGAGAQNTGGTLNYTQADTQFARVDLLSANAGAFSLGAGNVIRNFYTGVDPNVGPNTLYPIPYRTYSFDITGFALAGQTYQIRFADVGSQFILNTGVDDVSVLAVGPAASAPEPASLAFLLLGGGAWAVKRRANPAKHAK